MIQNDKYSSKKNDVTIDVIQHYKNYEDYLQDIGIDKNTPIKIQWSNYDRGFYCPTCKYGVSINESICKECGQTLLPYIKEKNDG